MDDMDSEWAGGRQGLAATHPTPATSSIIRGASWGRKTPEFPRSMLLPEPIQWAQSTEVREMGVRGQQNKLMERRGDGAREEERKGRLRETERGKGRSNEALTQRLRQSWRKRQKQLRGNEGTVETAGSSEGGAGRGSQQNGHLETSYQAARSSASGSLPVWPC